MPEMSFWIDTDTASDDACALVMALRAPNISVEGISVVAGNVGLEQCVQNALYTVELCGETTPVYVGCHQPIMRELEDASEVHGEDGMGDIGLDLKGRKPAKENAIDTMVECITSSPGKIRLVTLGPLSNIAAAILKEPTFAEAVEHCYIMGGAAMAEGNVTPSAEYNIWADPEAAHIVLESGMKITIASWDVCLKAAFIDDKAEAEIRAIGTKYADFALDIQKGVAEFTKEKLGLAGFDLPDPLAMAVAIAPEIAETKEVYIQVATGDGIARGQTILDNYGLLEKQPNAKITTHVEPKVFKDMLIELLK